MTDHAFVKLWENRSEHEAQKNEDGSSEKHVENGVYRWEWRRSVFNRTVEWKACAVSVEDLTDVRPTGCHWRAEPGGHACLLRHIGLERISGILQVLVLALQPHLRLAHLCDVRLVLRLEVLERMCQTLSFALVRTSCLAQGGELSLRFRFYALGIGLRFGELVLEILDFCLEIPVFTFVFVCKGGMSKSVRHTRFDDDRCLLAN